MCDNPFARLAEDPIGHGMAKDSSHMRRANARIKRNLFKGRFLLLMREAGSQTKSIYCLETDHEVMLFVRGSMSSTSMLNWPGIERYERKVMLRFQLVRS